MNKTGEPVKQFCPYQERCPPYLAACLKSLPEPQTVAREPRDVRERRDPKFEVQGSKFRKPRTSDLEPLSISPVPQVSRVSCSYPPGCSGARRGPVLLRVFGCLERFPQPSSKKDV